nr:RNA polymerase II transcription factor B subunit 2-like isoform X2 [Ipomoea batatas]
MSCFPGADDALIGLDRKKDSSYQLNPKFQYNLRKHIVHGGILPREPMPSNITVRLPKLEELDAYASEQWELMDTNAQLWYIIREYINHAEAFSLCSTCRRVAGHAFTVSHPPFFMKMDLPFALGVVDLWESGVDSADLIAFLLELSFHVAGEGFVVVETNFRMYAYSSSKLHCEILRLFARVEYQLPNLIVGAISKESLYKAFQNGISSEQASDSFLSLHYSIMPFLQIVSFLQQNAHPRVAERIPAVPENVTDQIRLWESDLNRVEMMPAHLYEEFPSRDAFEAACDFAREYGGLLWEDSKRMRIVVKAEILANMKEFLRRKQ